MIPFSYWDLITHPFPILNSPPPQNEPFDYGDGDCLFLAAVAIKTTEHIFHLYYAFLLTGLPVSIHLKICCLNNLPLSSSIMLLCCRLRNGSRLLKAEHEGPAPERSGSFTGSCLLGGSTGSWPASSFPPPRPASLLCVSGLKALHRASLLLSEFGVYLCPLCLAK